jgi:hypothetical protein
MDFEKKKTYFKVTCPIIIIFSKQSIPYISASFASPSVPGAQHVSFQLLYDIFSTPHCILSNGKITDKRETGQVPSLLCVGKD